jgi:hypothetical protein
MTLPELLISIMVTGTLVAAMAVSTAVILRQADNSEGRLNNTRSEQSVGLWMPADLASAETVSTDPAASPCSPPFAPGPCPAGVNVGGSNALLLSWTGYTAGATDAIPTVTTVSYRYVEIDGEFHVVRVACISIAGAPPECDQLTLLHNVEPPPVGTEWIPGTTRPEWVMLVALALDPAAPDEGSGVAASDDPTYHIKNGRRVTVTINGGGDIAGLGGGQDKITLSAGGVDRDPDLSTTNINVAPTFSATRSRCGGNFGMLVDTSGSIGSTNMTNVRGGITQFINSFAGTPIKLQVVRFSSTASTLGAGAGWSRYYDMLVEADVADLKAQVATLTSNGSTNWEDALFRMFMNSDGTTQQLLPDTLIFFTDGMPTYNRLNASSATAPAVVNPDDIGFPGASGSSFNQLSWNRANRVARQFDADVDRFIGVYVGSDVNGSSTWSTQGAGYHLENFQKGYHLFWEQGYNITNPQRGYHQMWEYASNTVFQYASAGMTYQYATTGMTFQQKVSGNWNTIPVATYINNNSTPDETDNYRAVAGATPGGWTNYSGSTSTAKTNYDKSNTVAGTADGFRATATGPGTWKNTTKAYYDINNTASGSGDGFRIGTGGNSGWTEVTQAYYNLSNTTTDSSDGFRTSNSYTAPYSAWENSTAALFVTNNTTSDESDGWRATVVNAAPYNYWTSVTQGVYDGGNTTTDDTDGWRVSNVYTSPFSLWESTDEASYTTYNTSWGSTDGWSATKVYQEPYTFHENITTSTLRNTEILSRIITVGDPVPAVPTGGPYTNAAVADFYALPDWAQFAGAINAVALAECGGTVTVQTRVGSAAAADPFTYQNSQDLTIATTSQQYRSGTFDFDMPDGQPVTVDISPVDLSNLARYAPVSWACRANGLDYPFTPTVLAGSEWSKITLTVAPNTAVSCIQTVRIR